MKKQRYIVEIEMPDGDFISAGWLKDLIQTDCDLEDESRKKVTVQETSRSSDLGEAAEEYSLDVKAKPYGNLVKEAFKSGATWRDAQIPSLPSNLDEAAEEFGKRQGVELARFARKFFKAGAEWMAGQFQKIEGDLVNWYSTSDGKEYCCGIKTDEAFEIPEGFYIRKKQ